MALINNYCSSVKDNYGVTLFRGVMQCDNKQHEQLKKSSDAPSFISSLTK